MSGFAGKFSAMMNMQTAKVVAMDGGVIYLVSKYGFKKEIKPVECIAMGAGCEVAKVAFLSFLL